MVGDSPPEGCSALAQWLWAGTVPWGSLSRWRRGHFLLFLKWWREGRNTRPTKLLHVFEIPFVPGHLAFQSCFQTDWMMMASMPKEKISSKKRENNNLKAESKENKNVLATQLLEKYQVFFPKATARVCFTHETQSTTLWQLILLISKMPEAVSYFSFLVMYNSMSWHQK